MEGEEERESKKKVKTAHSASRHHAPLFPRSPKAGVGDFALLFRAVFDKNEPGSVEELPGRVRARIRTVPRAVSRNLPTALGTQGL